MRVASRTVFSLFVFLSIIGFVDGRILGAASLSPMAEHSISNGVLSIGICDRYAGAVCSLIYDGHELVNNYDHGRQMQAAWFVNGDLTGAINPTEAGSHDDGRGPTSTSHLVSVKEGANTLTTENHPAYWFRPGRGGLNAHTVTNDTLKKTIALGYNGDPHVIVFDASVTLSPHLTGPPIKRIRIEVPAFYTSKELSEHYQLDRRNGRMVKLSGSVPDKMNHMNPRMGLNTNRQLIPVLSSPDGRYAVAEYTPQAQNFWTYSSYSIPSDNPAFACNKVTTRFDQSAEVGHTYSYHTFIVIGDLETVKNSVMKLP